MKFRSALHARSAIQGKTMKPKRFPLLRALFGVTIGLVLVGLVRILQPIVRHALRVSGYQHWISSES